MTGYLALKPEILFRLLLGFLMYISLPRMACSPSVPMQDVPRETLCQHLGFGFGRDEKGRNELNEWLSRICQTQIHTARYDKMSTLQLRIRKVLIPGTYQVVKTTGNVVLTVHPPPG